MYIKAIHNVCIELHEDTMNSTQGSDKANLFVTAFLFKKQLRLGTITKLREGKFQVTNCYLRNNKKAEQTDKYRIKR